MYVETKRDGEQIGKTELALMETEALLRKEGWVHGNPLRLGLPGYCVGNALARVVFKGTSTDYPRCFELQDRLLRAALVQTGKQWVNIPEYNDAPERTIEDVWELFRIAENL